MRMKGNRHPIRKSVQVDGIGPEQDTRLAAVAELLCRERAALTFDELERVDRRLNRLRAQPRPPRRSSRVAVAVCLALGLLLMTGGTGIAISGFVTPGSAGQARYPGLGAGGPRSGRPPSGNGGRPSGRTPGSGNPGSAPGSRGRYPLKLGQIPPAAQPTSTVDSLTHAETRSNLPFTGADIIPILLAGVGLVITATVVNRRMRGGWGRL
jgi:hypothetical protein